VNTDRMVQSGITQEMSLAIVSRGGKFLIEWKII
jgi:hypothetical protein